MSDQIDDRLGKIIALAKRGVGGERTNAEKLVRQICERESLDFDDLMRDGEKVERHYLLFRSKLERRVLAQVLYHFALTKEHPDIWNSQSKTSLIFECTAARFVETSYAWTIYRQALRREQEKVNDTLVAAFTYKHHLFKTWDDEPDNEKLPTAEDLERYERALLYMKDMEHVELRKAIEART